MEKKIISSYNKKQNYFDKPNNELFQNINDDLTSSTSTTTTNNNTNTTTVYFSNSKTHKKKNVLSIQQNKNNNQISSNNLGIQNINIYSKGKIRKTIGNTNNIIINNNTNIINNNNTNIINNNFNNNNNDIDNKEYMNSINQLNMEQINEINNTNQLLNNMLREKPLIINKGKINQKNYILVKNNNIINNNINNNNINININKKNNNIINNKRNKNINNNINKNINNNNINNNMNNNINNNNINNINNNINNINNNILKYENNLDEDNNNKDYKNIGNNHLNNNKNQNEENSAILNVEELLMIEEKLSSLINCLSNNNPCTEECFECLNFYFTTKLSKNINKYFINEKYLQIIKKIMNLILFSYILCYHISLNENIFPQFIATLKGLFDSIHNILILISKYFSNKIIEDCSNIWVKKLQNLIQGYDSTKKSANEIFDELNNLYFKLSNNLYPILLGKYNQKKLIEIYNNINILSQNDLYKLFIDNIYINKNINGSIIASTSFFEENKNTINNFIPIPYLKNKSNKQYTLVLDLDETLIHFKGNMNDDSTGLLQFRPFLSEFLSNIKNYYELIVFTAATQDYADPIINAIEQKGTKFDYRLYREHTRVINCVFLKDLSRLGRDMSRIIIVDNMEQNYKLQPDNGITIRPFWGKDTNDLALFDLLYILITIAKKNMDVREGIKNFKEDIISKVTSNIFRRVQY